ncbi:MAG: uracil-DNA glycosylase [Anaerolineae bacterium]|nr:uracil-DNA glycosylase [Anaerolineae bacterium]
MTDSLEQVANEVAVCTRCPLHTSRVKSVPGEGPSDAQIVLIGEGPGFHENQSGRPFVGAAGEFLSELLQTIGLSREEVFICNVVKCRPPGNRDPEPIEIEACRAYLDRQIALINPKVIVTLGRYSMARWFPSARISHIHGKPRNVGKCLVVPMYHPAAALHQPSLKQEIIDDFRKLPQFLADVHQERIESGGSEATAESDELPQQLSLF